MASVADHDRERTRDQAKYDRTEDVNATHFTDGVREDGAGNLVLQVVSRKAPELADTLEYNQNLGLSPSLPRPHQELDTSAAPTVNATDGWFEESPLNP